MAADELIELWGVLDTEPRTSFEILRRIGDCYIALSPARTPALIVALPEGDALGRGRALGSVRLRYESALHFEVGGTSWTQAAAVIDCMDPRLVRTFGVVVRDMLERLNASGCSAKHVAAALSAWDELLRHKKALDEAAALGLWGELLLIAESTHPAEMVDAWRGPHGDAFDFHGGGVALECKTSTRRLRHHVSQRQSSLAGDALSAYLVSIWVAEDATAGKSLVDLIDQIVASVPDEAPFMHKLLIAGYREEHRHEYVRRFSCPSKPLWFEMESVPQIRVVDEGVSNVRYDVDLTRVKPVPSDEVASRTSALTGKER